MSAPALEDLVSLLAKLPGLGPRSARRAVLHMIKKQDQLMIPLTDALKRAIDNLHICSQCGNVDAQDPCTICTDAKRDQSTICVVEDVADLWAMERANIFKGQYFVLGGRLSALDGIGPDDLKIPKLVNRVGNDNVSEVILAMNATIDGQTTAHYIHDQLIDTSVNVSRLAHGVPIGGELDFLDEGTISAALSARKSMASGN